MFYCAAQLLFFLDAVPCEDALKKCIAYGIKRQSGKNAATVPRLARIRKQKGVQIILSFTAVNIYQWACICKHFIRPLPVILYFALGFGQVVFSVSVISRNRFSGKRGDKRSKKAVDKALILK